MTHQWVSMHIFYYSNPERMMTDCLGPLVQNLREQGLIQRFFFIRYWMEGMHIRFRLLPAEGVEPAAVKEHLEPAVISYLQRCPALSDPTNTLLPEYYRTFFLGEYGEKKWHETYGADGIMPTRPNNSFAYIAYEPEYHHYGGSSGVELAEWHFEQSSALIMKLFSGGNAHLRTIKLGLSFRLSLPFYCEFLGDPQVIVDYLAISIQRWSQSFAIGSTFEIYEKKYRRMAPSLHQCISQIHTYITRRKDEGLTPLEREWIDHIHELRQRLDLLITGREIIFPGQEHIFEQGAIYRQLLSRYIHMTNNRLGVTIPDEIYVAYLLTCSLNNRALPPQERTV